jgi:hypothetical protein
VGSKPAAAAAAAAKLKAAGPSPERVQKHGTVCVAHLTAAAVFNTAEYASWIKTFVVGNRINTDVSRP